MAAILYQEPLPLRRYTRDEPAELERIVGKALQKDREGADASKIILVSPPRQEGQDEGSQTRPPSAGSLPTLILIHYVPNEEPGHGLSRYRAASLDRSGTDKFRYRSHIEAGYLNIEPDDPYFESAGVDVKMLGKLWQYRYGDDEGVYFGEKSQLGEPCDDSDTAVTKWKQQIKQRRHGLA